MWAGLHPLRGALAAGLPHGAPARALGRQRRWLNRACGLVGYPNVGKSTLFNAFAGASLAEAGNFPFCTIEPNVTKVSVPDPRLEALAEACGSARLVPGTVEVRDVAGLIRGASTGAGMGNAFLSQLRGVQVLLHVVRCFSDERVVHIEDPVNIDPVREYEGILEELTIADLEYASRRLPSLRNRAAKDDEVKARLPIYEAALAALEASRPARGALPPDAPPGDEFLGQLLTAKPLIVLANVAAEDAAAGNALSAALRAHVEAGPGACRCVPISAALEAEVVQLDDEDFRREYLESYGLQDGERALPLVMAESQRLLRLISFLTVGEVEARAWFVPEGSRAHEAAGAIHSDFVRNFEQAEIWTVEDLVRLGKAGCRKAGLVRSRGKDYVVQDGDVVEFRIKGGRS